MISLLFPKFFKSNRNENSMEAKVSGKSPTISVLR